MVIDLQPAANFPAVKSLGWKGRNVVRSKGISLPYTIQTGWSSDGSKEEYFAVINGAVIPLLEMLETGCVILDPNRMGDPFNQRYLLVEWPRGEETVGERDNGAEYIVITKTVSGKSVTPSVITL